MYGDSMEKNLILTATKGIWSYDFLRCELTASFTDTDGKIIALSTRTGGDNTVTVTVQRQTPSGQNRTWLQGCVPRRGEKAAIMTEDFIALTFEDYGKTFEALILFQTRELRLSEVIRPAEPVRRGHIEGSHAFRVSAEDERTA